MKIDSYHEQQKRRPMNLISENIRRRTKRIFAEVPRGGSVNDSGVDGGSVFGGFLGNFRDIASTIIWQ